MLLGSIEKFFLPSSYKTYIYRTVFFAAEMSNINGLGEKIIICLMSDYALEHY